MDTDEKVNRGKKEPAETAPEPEPIPELVPVTVIEKKGDSALIQWVEDGVHRGYVPEKYLVEGQIPIDVRDKAAPYGLAWEDVPLSRGSLSAHIARELRNAGIWTPDDLRKEQRAAIGALQRALSVHLGALNAFARKKEE